MAETFYVMDFELFLYGKKVLVLIFEVFVMERKWEKVEINDTECFFKLYFLIDLFRLKP